MERVVRSLYIRNVFLGWMVVVGCALFFPVVYGTFDISFLRAVGAQSLHLLAALPVLAYLKYRDYSFQHIGRVFVYLFVVQALIQCIVFSNPAFGEIILYFNKFEPEDLVGLGADVRGKALSAATTYHLSLVYGIGFLIYVKEFLSNKISLNNILVGLLVFVGIFFAGRTGFVGVAIGLVAFMLSRNVKWWQKFKMLLYILTGISAIIGLINIFLPDFYELMFERVLPYAFEFIYSMDNSGQLETASTNQLLEMWSGRDFDYMELLLGSGRYTDEMGKYYMGVDPGILRHTLFMGIIGYGLLVAYQLLLLPFWKIKDSKTRYYYFLIFVYLCAMDFKGVTLGVNKFVFAATLLLSFSYFELRQDQENTPKTQK